MSAPALAPTALVAAVAPAAAEERSGAAPVELLPGCVLGRISARAETGATKVGAGSTAADAAGDADADVLYGESPGEAGALGAASAATPVAPGRRVAFSPAATLSAGRCGNRGESSKPCRTNDIAREGHNRPFFPAL